jgi:hypothetical protein
MHSKWQIWDFFSSFRKDHLGHLQGIQALQTFDPLCLKLVKDFLIRGAGDRIIHHRISSEVTKSWIEEEFQTLSLFGGADCFYIHQAQDLKTEMLDAFNELKLNDRFIILLFEAESTSWKKLVKDNKIPTLVIESPRFWELNKLLDFTASYLRLPLSFEAKAWILDSLENNLSTFYNSCVLLKLNYPDVHEINLEQVKNLFQLEKLDQFAMASTFSRKKFKDFYERLILLEGDFEKMRSFFNFMQSHLIKLADTSYMSQKNRLTQYDKDLQNTAKLWHKDELIAEIERFNRWEIALKRKDNLIWHELHVTYLQQLQSSQFS